jgi:hypothetical protein
VYLRTKAYEARPDIKAQRVVARARNRAKPEVRAREIKQTRAAKKQRYLVNPLLIKIDRVRCAVANGLRRRGYSKTSRTYTILGADYNTVIKHLEVSWAKNYPAQKLDWKQVHIDHIVPLASAKTEIEVIQLNHYTNLQLLTARDNLVKKDKV